jgi:hypothetical protein
MHIATVRARMLAAMGLGAVGCAGPAPAPVVVQPVVVPVAGTSSASPAPSNSNHVTVVVVSDAAPATSVVAPAPVPVAASATVGPRAADAGPPSVAAAIWSVTYPLTSPGPTQWCTKEGTAQCLLASQVQPTAGTAVSKNLSNCPVARPVACSCAHKNCPRSDALACSQPLLEKMSSLQRRLGRGEACCYEVDVNCGYPGEGRPLLGGTGPVVAGAVLRDDWTSPALAQDPARDWTHTAALEHASIASFAVLSLDLMALGAPAHLLRGAHLAALDEIAHAEYAFAMASPEGKRLGPGPLPIPARPSPTLAGLAVESLRDGCFGETAAALSLQRRAERSSDLAQAKILATMAEDELRHAELAFAIVAWAVRQGGDAVLHAVSAEAAKLDPHQVTLEVVVPCVRALQAAA